MATTPARLLVRGSINIDEVYSVKGIVKPGETIASTGYKRSPGGKGANLAVASALAGASVDFVGCIGNDPWLIARLEKDGVGTSLLEVDESTTTGRAIIQVSESGDNSIILLAGSNASSLPIPSSLSQYTYLLLQNEIPLSETKMWLSAAKLSGVATVFNPSPLPSLEELRAFAWRLVDYVIVNEEEAQSLVRYLGTGQEAEEDLATQLATAFSSIGVDTITIVITKGAQGVVLCSKRFGPGIISQSLDKFKVTVSDTTGAGDCFTGYFVAALSRITTPQSLADYTDILSIAVHAAAMSVEKDGAMDSYPNAEQVVELLSMLQQCLTS